MNIGDARCAGLRVYNPLSNGVTDRAYASAGYIARFQNDYAPPGFAQAMGRCQAGETRPNNDDGLWPSRDRATRNSWCDEGGRHTGQNISTANSTRHINSVLASRLAMVRDKICLPSYLLQ